MQKEIRDGVIILTFPTGVVDVYGIERVETFKGVLEQDIASLQTELNNANADLKAMRSSLAPSTFARIIKKVFRRKA